MRSKSFIRWLFVLALVVGFLPTGAAQTQSGNTNGYKPGELLVKFDPSASAKTLSRFRELAGAQYSRTIAGSDVQIWQVPIGSEIATGQMLAGQPGVILAEPNYKIHAFDTVPNDPLYYRQWAHPKMGSPAAWGYTIGSSSVTIAVVDTGIDETHPDLASKIVPGYDFVDGDSNPHDLNGHGTHVAGIAAAATNNSEGVAGTSWGARLMPVRVLDASGSGYTSDLIGGILWASQQGARIINFSLGGVNYSQALQDAVNVAHNAGLLFVAAMGNDNTSVTFYPAGMANVLGVAATNRYDLKAQYSNTGNHCDLAAPGGDMSYYHDPDGIYSTMPTYPVDMTTTYSYYENYDYLQGTSQATPYVSGLAALIWSRNPSLTADEVQQLMQSTAVDLGAAGWDPIYGWGRIDVAAAVAAAVPINPPDLHAIANTDGDGSYMVEWGSIQNATQYTLQEDDNPNFTSPKLVYQGSATHKDVSGQSAGYYYYRVRAENAQAISDWSQTRTAGVVPGSPTLQLTPDATYADEYLLSWTQVAGADGYILQESQTASFTLPATRYQGSALSYAVTGQDGGDWYYRIAAANQAGSSPWGSSVISITVPAPALPAPTLQAISNLYGHEAFPLQWTVVTTATSYILEASRDMYFSSPTPVYTGPLTAYSMQTDSGGTWFFRVRAASAAGRSAWSLPRSTLVYYRIRLPVMMKTKP